MIRKNEEGRNGRRFEETGVEVEGIGYFTKEIGQSFLFFFFDILFFSTLTA